MFRESKQREVLARVWKRVAAVAVVFAGYSSTALSVEVKHLQLTEKWSVVGVITSSNPQNDVAVLKNNETSKTYTMTRGDSLPSEINVKLTEIKRRSVEVSDGENSYTLGFVDTPVAEEKDDFQDSVRFIDNYYRGLADSPIEFFSKERPEGQVQGMTMPPKSYGALTNISRSRFERPDQGQDQFQEQEQESGDWDDANEYYEEQLPDYQPEVIDAPVYSDQEAPYTYTDEVPEVE